MMMMMMMMRKKHTCSCMIVPVVFGIVFLWCKTVIGFPMISSSSGRGRSRRPIMLSLKARRDHSRRSSGTFMRLFGTPSSSSSTTTSTTTPSENITENNQKVIHSKLFGDIRRIRTSAEEDDSFLSTNAVPTYAVIERSSSSSSSNSDGDRSSYDLCQSSDTTTTTKTTIAGGLEGVLKQGPSFVLDHVMSKETCNELIHLLEHQLGFGTYETGKNHHGALQLIVSQSTADTIAQALSRHVNIQQVHERHLEMIHNSDSRRSSSTNNGNDDNDNNNSDDATLDKDIRFTMAGLNRRWRVYRYEPNTVQTFAPHIDAGFPPSSVRKVKKDNNDDNDENDDNDDLMLVWDATEENEQYHGQDIVARLTVLMYLNDDFVGGETNFYKPRAASTVQQQQQQGDDHDDLPPPPPDPPLDLLCSIRPQTGSVLVFPQAVGEEAVAYARRHWPLHEGAPVRSGQRPKYVIRSDILFVQETQTIDRTDYYVKHDMAVRNTFQLQSSVMDPKFLHHVDSLYNPHMGVENLGPFLYSFIRFTKPRRCIEIGAGYTSLWILQALKDNDDEWERIRQLGRRGECLLLDIPWANPEIVEQYDKTAASLLFVDNCQHQKETATGASAVAKTLGLESYMEFMVADAFDLELPTTIESIDLLWCDFGVGSRMADFGRQIWKSIRPGGFLICHSTLTNRGTRTWLEAIRSGTASEDITGLPPGEYVELSLLEPHKRYQNSITILQKRKASDGSPYEEPIYSQYA